jgi:hypothetical protein
MREENAHKSLTGKSEGKRQFGRSRLIEEENINIVLN